jgi:hypothetical protein
VDRAPGAGATFAPLPAAAMRRQAVDQWRKTLESHLYQNVSLELLSCPAMKLTSLPGEKEGDFQARLAQALREKRDLEVARLKAKYAPRLQTLTDQLRRAEDRVEREKAQAGQMKIQTALSVGATLLGAFLGRRMVSAGNIGRATTAMRQASKIGKETADVARADESATVLRERLAALEQQFQDETTTLQGQMEVGAVEVRKTQVRLRKSDVTVGTVGLCWTP